MSMITRFIKLFCASAGKVQTQKVCVCVYVHLVYGFLCEVWGVEFIVRCTV